jgi:IMP dehydrogenase
MKFENAAGEQYWPSSWLTFNDVLLKPQRSPFISRMDSHISLVSCLAEGVSLDIPFISANMDTVTGSKMAIEMSNLGGLGILHRFYPSLEDYKQEIMKVHNAANLLAFSVGCGSKWILFAKEIIEQLNPKFPTKAIICLDVAHGHMEQAIETVQALREIPNITIMAGNVATPEGVLDLASAGAHCVKVGVGSGSVCTTRIVTGHGVPQLSAIISARQALEGEGLANVGIIADGGIRNGGDIVKAIAAGADAVMLGSMLAGCDETPGEIFTTKDGSFKMYRGQSSRHFLKDIGKMGVAAEGESIEIKAKGSVKEVISELEGGIRSGLTYSGASDLYDLQNKAVFLEISHHGWVESTPHAITRVH